MNSADFSVSMKQKQVTVESVRPRASSLREIETPDKPLARPMA